MSVGSPADQNLTATTTSNSGRASTPTSNGRRRSNQPASVSISELRSKIRTLTGVRICGTGSFVPERVVQNSDLAALGYDEDWIVQRTGIRERRHADPNVASSDLATEAARRCLRNAKLHSADVDLLIVATMTPDTPLPSTACHVQHQLGLKAPAMDLNAACAGFMYGLITGMQFVKANTYEHVMVIGTDTNSRIVNPDDKKTYPLFGDGAGAVLLSPSSTDHGLLSYTLGADGAGTHLLDDRRTEGDVGNEMTVHHVEMDPVGTGTHHGLDLVAEPRKIRRQNGGRNDCLGHVVSSPCTWPGSRYGASARL